MQGARVFRVGSTQMLLFLPTPSIKKRCGNESLEEKGYLFTKQGHAMSQPLHSPSRVSPSCSIFCEINLRDPLKKRTIQRGSSQPVGRGREDPSASSRALLVVSGTPFQGPSLMLNSSHSQLPEPDPVSGSAASSFVTLGKLFHWTSIFSSVKWTC